MNYKIKSHIWVEVNNKVLLGEGRVQLLKAIAKTGSLSKGARSLKMSYKKAWKLIDSINKSAEKPVIITSIGGKNGGGAQLTDYGHTLINAFDSINKECWKHLDSQTHQLEDL